MVQSLGTLSPGRQPRGRGIAPVLAVVGVLLVVALLAGNNGGNWAVLEDKEGEGGDASHYEWRHEYRPYVPTSTLQQEKDLIEKEEKEVERERPLVGSTEDTYIASRLRVSSLKSKEADNQEASKKLGSEVKNDDARVKGALLARKAAAQKAATRLSALKQAEADQRSAQAFEDKALRYKDNSEEYEAEGIAIQKPAAALLKDSKKLNDQSNLVLDQSHSSQAKALAALDLNLAQSLATRASQGMQSAKKYFSEAIDGRKRAVAADQLAAQDTIEAAKESLAVNHEMPALLHVVHGQLTGDAAFRAVIGADLKSVEDAEDRLGDDREAVRAAYEHRADAIRQMQLVTSQAKALHSELLAAEQTVVKAAKAHLLATKTYREAAALREKAQEKTEELESKQGMELDKMLKVAEKAKDEAMSRYHAADGKVQSLIGKQTLLQMEVARLRLQLKEAQMQSASLKEKNEGEHETISHLRTKLDEEDGDLNSVRLQLADARIRGHSSAAGEQESDEGGRGRVQDTVHSEAEQAEGEAYHHSDEVLRERLNERQVRDEQVQAEARARDEEAKLRQAQAAVQQQMDKVQKLEASV